MHNVSKAAESSIVAKCAQILDVLSDAGEPVSFSRILRDTAIAKSSCHRILAVLQTENLVEYNPDTRTYKVGSRLRDWSHSEWRRKDLQQAASATMARLSETTGMNSALSILDRDAILYVRTINMVPFRYASHAGDHAPLHCTAAGKVFLSYLSESRLQSLVEALPLEKCTENTLEDPEALLGEIPAIRQQGFAVSRQEEVLQVTGIAAPVFNRQDEVVASLSLWSLHSVVSAETIIGKSAELIEAANTISIGLGWNDHAYSRNR